MNNKMITIILMMMLVLLSGCADNLTFTQAIEADAVGFWYGLWHGMIILFSFFGSLFFDDVAIYAIYNNGEWYDFGFWLGIWLLAWYLCVSLRNL